jgi:hypothetical protein
MASKTKALETAKTRKVRVHEQRTYVDEEPVVDLEALEGLEGLESLPADPIADFLATLDAERQLNLHVFVHPNFPRDGKMGSRSERMFVTSFAFTVDEPETYRQRVQYCYPQGGMFTMELRERGAIIKRWEEQLSPVPGYEPPKTNSSYPFPPPPAVTIKMPEQQAQTAPPDPLEMIEKQASMFIKIGEVFKSFQPPATTIVAGNGEHVAEKPLEDRIIETVLIKALENDKAPIDKVLDILSGRRAEKPGFMDSLGPVFLELAKGIAPAISMGIQSYMRSQVQAAQAMQLPTVEGQPSPEQSQPQIQAPTMDPAERAWRRVVQRMLEDCFEHVSIIQTLSAVGSVSPDDGMNVKLHAGAIYDLLDRFQTNEQLVGMVQMLLNAEPPEVVDMCALLQNSERDQMMVLGLKEAPVALEWLKELQEETKKILAEGENESE